MFGYGYQGGYPQQQGYGYPQQQMGYGQPQPQMGYAQPNMMGYSNVQQSIGNYAYRNQNWNGYQMRAYRIDPQFIEQYGPGIFQYFDRDRSGTLDMVEVPQMINHLFNYLKMPPPNMQDIYYTMAKHDLNGDGKMNFQEFRQMMYFLGGQR